MSLKKVTGNKSAVPYCAAGNYFLAATPGVNFSSDEVRSLCRLWRCDGVLMGQINSPKDIALTIANRDGTAAEISGNGTRIYAKFLLDSGEISGNCCDIRTPSGKVRCEFGADEIVYATFGPCTVAVTPMEIKLRSCNISGYGASAGNPHFIVPVEGFPKNWRRLAAEIATNENFPNGVNIEFAKITGPNSMAVRIWERGVGRTLSCGSGAACCAEVFSKLFPVDGEIAISMEGGVLTVAAIGELLRVGGKVERATPIGNPYGSSSPHSGQFPDLRLKTSCRSSRAN